MSTILLRGHSAEHIFRLLAGAEANPPSQAFRKTANWLLSEGYLNRILLGASLLPGLERVGRVALLWRRFVGKRILAKCAADAIYVKSNVRAFYLNQRNPRAVKIVVEQTPQRLDGIRNEVRIRQQIKSFDCLNIPALLSDSVACEWPWYSEEVLSGRLATPRDEDLIAARLVPALFNLYQHFGVTWKTTFKSVRNHLWPLVEAAASRLRGHSLDLQALLDRATCAPSALLPSSIGHGDLSPTNLIITPHRDVYVIDWEAACVRPILFDLCPLLISFPAARNAVREHLDNLQTGVRIPFPQQYLLAIFAQIGFWQRKIELEPSSATLAREHIRLLFHAARSENPLSFSLSPSMF